MSAILKYVKELEEENKKLKKQLAEKTLDLVQSAVEVMIKGDGSVIWVNAPNCVLRICQIKSLLLKDNRKKSKTMKIFEDGIKNNKKEIVETNDK